MYFLESRRLESDEWVRVNNHNTDTSAIAAYDFLCKETMDALQVVQKVERIICSRDRVDLVNSVEYREDRDRRRICRGCEGKFSGVWVIERGYLERELYLCSECLTRRLDSGDGGQ
jgi:hypothetical protein